LLVTIPQWCPVLPAGWQVPDGGTDSPKRRAKIQELNSRAHVWQGGRWTLAVPVTRVSPRYGQGFARFFPNLTHPEDPGRGVPSPDSPAFWHEYVEPVDQFLGQANQLQATLESLLAIDPARVLVVANQVAALEDAFDGEDSDWDEEEFGPLPLYWDEQEDELKFNIDQDLLGRAVLAVEGEDTLNSLTSTVSPVVRVGLDLRYELAWRFRSLIASFAMIDIDHMKPYGYNDFRIAVSPRGDHLKRPEASGRFVFGESVAASAAPPRRSPPTVSDPCYK